MIKSIVNEKNNKCDEHNKHNNEYELDMQEKSLSKEKKKPRTIAFLFLYTKIANI